MGLLKITDGKLKAAREQPQSAALPVRLHQHSTKKVLCLVPLLVLEGLLRRFVKLFQLGLGWRATTGKREKEHQRRKQQRSLKDRPSHRSS